METLQHLLNGFALVTTPGNLLYCFIGVLWGTVVGILPGLGPMGGIAILLPLTFRLDPVAAIILLAGIFYGAMYGGSTTSILLNIPGEAASVITCIDGYQMARQGRAGPALMISALGSFFGGTVSVIGLMLFAPPLAKLIIRVGPAEEFAFLLLALIVLSYVSGESKAKTAAMITLGLLIASVGMDPFTGYYRFTLGTKEFVEGIDFVPLSIGLFGVSEILINLEEVSKVEVIKPTFASLLPKWKDLKASAGPVWRGSVIGFIFGIVPGISHVTSTFVSYATEKRFSKHPEEFGKGRIEGVAGPETANNATTGSAMIPMLVLGIPSIPPLALLMSGLLIHGVTPGPRLITNHPDVFWGLIASMYLGNAILVILNLPLVGIFVNILRIRYAYMVGPILMVCIIGVYSVNSSTFDIMLIAAAGLLGYFLRKFDFDLAPLVMALVLGPRLERSFFQALTISNGEVGIFGQSILSKVLLSGTFLIIVFQLILWFRRLRSKGHSAKGVCDH